MKHALLFVLIIPTILNARIDPRVPCKAPYDRVKSVEATYIFVIRSGNDTAITETSQYNQAGFLTNYNYDLHMMKNPPYRESRVYTYASNDSWTYVTYKNTKITDSAIVNGNWANHYWWYSGRIAQVNKFRGDSFAELNIMNGDTIFKHGDRKASMQNDNFWDYWHAGSFAGKTVKHSTTSDTTFYTDVNGKCMVMIVNFYDEALNAVKTDYYNFEVKRFDLFYLPYNDRMAMTFFLNKSKKGKWSFEITRKFDAMGRVIEEFMTDARPYKGANGTPVLKKYKYEFY